MTQIQPTQKTPEIKSDEFTKPALMEDGATASAASKASRFARRVPTASQCALPQLVHRVIHIRGCVSEPVAKQSKKATAHLFVQCDEHYAVEEALKKGGVEKKYTKTDESKQEESRCKGGNQKRQNQTIMVIRHPN